MDAQMKLLQVTEKQKEKLVEFMESNGDLTERYRRESPRWPIDKLWDELSQILNSMNEDPNKPIRTDQHWKRIWRSLKAQVGVKSVSKKPLTTLETRVYAIMVADVPTEFNVQSTTIEDVVVEIDPFAIGTHSVIDHVQVEDEVLPSVQAPPLVPVTEPPSPATDPMPSTSKQMPIPNQTLQEPKQTTLQSEQTPPIVSKQMSPRAKQMPSRDTEISPRLEEISPRPEEIPQPDVMPSTSQEPQAASSTETRPNNTDSKRVSPNNATGGLIPAMWTSADFESYNFPEARLSFERLREQNHHQREMRRLDLDSRRLGIDQQLLQALNRLADTNEKNIQKSG